MHSLILHHYPQSPYSEKIRAILGYKALSWQSVTQPIILPKPNLQLLTGGYRRLPVLQIGADIYCDSALIAEELQRRHPEPSLLPAGMHPLGEFLSAWADAWLFWRAARYATSSNIDLLPDEFLQDRAAMLGAKGFNRERSKAELPHHTSQLNVVLPWLESALNASEWLAGTAPSTHDFAVYHCLWFMLRTPKGSSLLKDMPKLGAWLERIQAIGHGSSSDLAEAEALHIARDAQPVASAGTPLPFTGKVAITPEIFGTEAVIGELVALETNRVVVAVENDSVGRVHVHFPRLGYVVTPQ